jgi:hypothetical protein
VPPDPPPELAAELVSPPDEHAAGSAAASERRQAQRRIVLVPRRKPTVPLMELNLSRVDYALRSQRTIAMAFTPAAVIVEDGNMPRVPFRHRWMMPRFSTFA